MIKVIDFVEGKVTENDVSENDWWALNQKVDVYLYDDLQNCCRDLVNIIDDDGIFCDVEWNLMHEYFGVKGFTKDDWEYVESCGYAMDQFIREEMTL